MLWVDEDVYIQWSMGPEKRRWKEDRIIISYTEKNFIFDSHPGFL